MPSGDFDLNPGFNQTEPPEPAMPQFPSPVVQQDQKPQKQKKMRDPSQLARAIALSKRGRQPSRKYG